MFYNFCKKLEHRYGSWRPTRSTFDFKNNDLIDQEFDTDVELDSYFVPFKVENEKYRIEIESITPSKLDVSLESDSTTKPSVKDNVMKKLSYLIIVVALTSIASGGVAFKMYPKDVQNIPKLRLLVDKTTISMLVAS